MKTFDQMKVLSAVMTKDQLSTCSFQLTPSREISVYFWSVRNTYVAYIAYTYVALLLLKL